MAQSLWAGAGRAGVGVSHRSLHWLDVAVVACSAMLLYAGLPQCIWSGNLSLTSLLLLSPVLLYFVWRLLIPLVGFALRCAQTAGRDLKGMVLLARVRWTMARAFREDHPLHYYFYLHLLAHPDKEAVVEVETGRSLTFERFNFLSNRYANYFLESRSANKGEVVAVYLENGIDFFALWLGLSKLGVITAWINSHLKMEPLLHSLQVSHAKTIVTSSRLLPTLMTAISHSKSAAGEFDILLVDGPDQRHGPMEIVSLAPKTEGYDYLTESDMNPVCGFELPTFQDVLCYIYTSGTTGQPKAAIIKHYRYYLMATASRYAFGIQPDDRLYVHMPMYHSAGGILGVGQALVTGCTVVIRTKFSASAFWSDCARFNCTASQYIGEIARYLLAQPERREERAHRVRVMYGNGMRPEIWGAFVKRFGVKRIGEFYGSTEGTSNLLNVDNHTGSCGFMPTYDCLNSLYPVRLIKVDEQSGEPLRDPNSGLCVTCRPGDTGEMVGLLKEDPMLRFEGYVDRQETGKKVIRDVVRRGDGAFASGDLLHWDRLGYLYFVDRRGDTFRWRGENVSTTQVEGIVQPVMAIVDASVYGVVVRGREGRAGMLAVSLADGTNYQEFLSDVSQRLADNLPPYAIPVFVRICREIDRTGTFKLKKALLQKEGYDPAKCQGDPLFFWDADAKSYLPLTKTMHADIDEGRYTKI